MRKMWIWLLLSWKRLWKKPLYVLLVLLLPVATLCYSAAAQEETGVVRIALAAHENATPCTRQVMEQLLRKDGLVHFVCVSPAEAERLVQTGKADGGWIFPKDLEEKTAIYLEDGVSPVVRVVQREENVLLRLSRELLSGVLYDHCVQPVYLRYLRQYGQAFAGLSDAELLVYMDAFRGNDRLFAFETLDGKALQTERYLTAPLQGLFGLLILLCALAGAMYFMQDCKKGRFQAVPSRYLGCVEFISVLVTVVGVSLAAAIGLLLCGIGGDWGKLSVLSIEYMLCCTAFACLMRRICGSTEVMAGILAALSVACLVICPVFLDIPQLEAVQWLLLPTWYIRGTQEAAWMLGMPVYGIACFIGCFVLDILQNKRRSTA